MGNLANLTDIKPDPTAEVRGVGRTLVVWWDTVADDEDRATFRKWVEDKVSYTVLAERITASGFPIGLQTVHYGIRLLRRHRWDN